MAKRNLEPLLRAVTRFMRAVAPGPRPLRPAAPSPRRRRAALPGLPAEPTARLEDLSAHTLLELGELLRARCIDGVVRLMGVAAGDDLETVARAADHIVATLDAERAAKLALGTGDTASVTALLREHRDLMSVQREIERRIADRDRNHLGGLYVKVLGGDPAALKYLLRDIERRCKAPGKLHGTYRSDDEGQAEWDERVLNHTLKFYERLVEGEKAQFKRPTLDDFLGPVARLRPAPPHPEWEHFAVERMHEAIRAAVTTYAPLLDGRFHNGVFLKVHDGLRGEWKKRKTALKRGDRLRPVHGMLDHVRGGGEEEPRFDDTDTPFRAKRGWGKEDERRVIAYAEQGKRDQAAQRMVDERRAWRRAWVLKEVERIAGHLGRQALVARLAGATQAVAGKLVGRTERTVRDWERRLHVTATAGRVHATAEAVDRHRLDIIGERRRAIPPRVSIARWHRDPRARHGPVMILDEHGVAVARVSRTGERRPIRTSG